MCVRVCVHVCVAHIMIIIVPVHWSNKTYGTLICMCVYHMGAHNMYE